MLICCSLSVGKMAGQMTLPEGDMESALTRYKKSLEDLTFNSKPLIDDLTRTAGQLEPQRAVQTIESRIMKVRQEWKLPLLYLMDSIMKNLKGSFMEHVHKVIVGVFCHCFAKLTDSDSRKSLYKLRTTWPPFLSKQKLAAIDKHVHALDPNWPVVAVDTDPLGTTIFVNPEFMGKRPQEASIQDRRKALLQKTKTQRQEQERELGLPVAQDNNKGKAQLEKVEDSQVLTASQPQRSRSTSPMLGVKVTTDRADSNHSDEMSDVVSKDTHPESPPAAKKIKVEPNSEDRIKQSHLQLDDLPPELLPVHYENMLKKIQRLIDAGNLTTEQRNTLVKQLEQLYELQKLKGDNPEPPPEPVALHRPETPPCHPEPPLQHPKPDPFPHPSQPPGPLPAHPSHPPGPLPPHPSHPPGPLPPHPSHPPGPLLSHPSHPPGPLPPHPSHPPGPLLSHPSHPPGPLPPHPSHPPRPLLSHPSHPPGPLPPHPSHPPGPLLSHPSHPPGPLPSHPPGPLPPHLSHPPGPLHPELGHHSTYRGYRGRRRPYKSRDHSRGHGGSNEGQNAGPVPVGDLIKNLVKAGMLEGEASHARNHPLKIPSLMLTPATLKQRYSSIIALLHKGDPCSSCGLRFLSNASEQYRAHLNWHYKVNRQEKEGVSTVSRNWFMHPDDWEKYEELQDETDGNVADVLELPREESPAKLASSERSSEGGEDTGCSVEAGDIDEVCAACNEPFEQFWEEEEASWHFRNALRTDPDGKLYHTFCYKDMVKT